MYIREKRDKSGSIGVKIIDTSGTSDRLIKTIGSTKDLQKDKELVQEAHLPGKMV